MTPITPTQGWDDKGGDGRVPTAPGAIASSGDGAEQVVSVHSGNAPSRWQLIDTAPQNDGAEFLVGANVAARHACFAGHMVWVCAIVQRDRGGALKLCWDYTLLDASELVPTHWCDLPTPPVTA